MRKFIFLLLLPLLFSCSNDEGEDVCTRLYNEHQQAIEDANGDEQAIDEAYNTYILGLEQNGCD